MSTKESWTSTKHALFKSFCEAQTEKDQKIFISRVENILESEEERRERTNQIQAIEPADYNIKDREVIAFTCATWMSLLY